MGLLLGQAWQEFDDDGRIPDLLNSICRFFFPLFLGSIRHLFLSNFGENYVNLVFIDFLGKKSRCPTASYRLQTKHCLGAQLFDEVLGRG